MRMGRRIAATFRRTAIHAGPTVVGIIVLDFLLLQLMPGDAADVIAAESGTATAETMAALRERFGLDQPVFTQLVNFL
ncbi:MAG: ABC transporter permease, partial [Reyranella sp.]